MTVPQEYEYIFFCRGPSMGNPYVQFGWARWWPTMRLEHADIMEKHPHPPHPPLPNREPWKVLKRCAAQVEVDVEHLVDTVRHNFTADKRQGSWDLMIWWRKVRISDDLGDYVWCLMIWSWAHVYSLYARLFYHAGKRHQTWHRVRKCRNRSHGWHLTTFN